MIAYTSGEIVDVALAIFLVLTGVGIAWVAFELGATLQQLSSFIRGTQEEVMPVISKVGTTVDHVNSQMEKLDRITDSAVDAADNADTAVRAVSLAVTRPVQKVSGFAAGVSHGVADFAHLVLGGLGARLELTYDFLEDITTAIDELLERRESSDDVTLTVQIDEGAITATVGPFSGRVADELHASDAGLGLRRVLETVVDDVSVSERDGAQWVELRKSLGESADAGQ